MTQLLSLLSSSDFLWAIVPPLACLVALLVTFPRFLLTFVQSWMQGKKYTKISKDLTQAFEESLVMILTNLKNQSVTEPLKDESTNIINQKQVSRDKLLELAEHLKEVLNNEEC